MVLATIIVCGIAGFAFILLVTISAWSKRDH